VLIEVGKRQDGRQVAAKPIKDGGDLAGHLSLLGFGSGRDALDATWMPEMYWKNVTLIF
jgi:hypothetical protein